ncbi:prefoldin subunit [Gregarina niphandrodes]|uniref:Prefoldin subunit n=1 Tax=Gregarina niphandrodes TaxID=110365 RepID=A0A023AZH9_GRENI|nr:prefoldin subunit [Gregarina niphandrodes]EZG44196.1 prefoldin subunit [Gregarina niphandrodes]|eukprot:XP_011132764.1 prefoldin subunit [Gregarina niphandrodes]
MSANLLEELNSQLSSARALEQQIFMARRKLNENLLATKRAEAALEEITSGEPPKRTFSQAGQAFVAVPTETMAQNLRDEIAALKNSQTVLKETDAKFVERLRNKKNELKQLEDKIKATPVKAN